MSKSNVVAAIGSDAGATIREKIVDAFVQRAKRVGIRSIVTDDLAKDAGISKKTLYKQFSSKKEMVAALVDLWLRSLEEKEAPTAKTVDDPVQTMRDWVTWTRENQVQYSPAFWSDLKRDYNDIYRVYQSTVTERMRALGRLMQPLLRADVSPGLAWELYNVMMAPVADPDFQQRVGLDRKQSAEAILEMWVRATMGPDYEDS